MDLTLSEERGLSDALNGMASTPTHLSWVCGVPLSMSPVRKCHPSEIPPLYNCEKMRKSFL